MPVKSGVEQFEAIAIGVIPNARAFTSGRRDLASIATVL